MRKIENLYHKTIALVFVVLLAVVTVIALHQDPAIREKPEEVKVQRAVGDFFTVGRYGHTLILETCTERTNGLEKQTHEAGKETRFLNGSSDEKKS